jgi:recombination protein RecA
MAKKKKSDNPEDLKAALEKIGGKVAQSLNDLEPEYYLSTGIFSLDRIISNKGGIPGNVCVEVYGPKGAGKTALALQILAQAQAQGMETCYVNAERAINEETPKQIPGFDVTKTYVWTPDNGEAVINGIEMLLRTQKNYVIINDSIPACLPSKVDEGTAEDSFTAPLAKLFTPAMWKFKKYCHENNNILIQTNQLRSKVNFQSRTPGTTRPGGHAIKFFSDLQIEVKKAYPGDIKAGEQQIGHRIEAKIQKTRHTIPFQTCLIPLIYGQGFDVGLELVEQGLQWGVVEKKGAWFTYDEQRYHGENALADMIRKNPEAQQVIKNEILELLA